MALSAESEAFYNKCQQNAESSSDGLKKRFSQQDFQTLAECTVTQLMSLVNELVDHCLLRSVRQQQQLSWILRTKKIASGISNLTEVEKMVFTIIEDADSAGIWVKRIKSVTNAPPNEVTKAINKLEKNGTIKGVRSVKAPAQRIYMLAHLAPSDDVTGGCFFDAGELDQSLIEELCNLIIFRIRQESWIESKRRIKREAIEIEDVGHKRPRESIEDEHGNKRQKLDRDDHDEHAETLQLAHAAGTKDYPTADSIQGFILTSGAIRNTTELEQKLTVEEVQGLLDMLVWDGKLERVRGGYRTVRGIRYEAFEDEDEKSSKGNGLTDIPCGRCKITNLCQEGTRVSAATCVYYQEWLTP